MIAYMEGLSLTEADNLKKTISKLFRQTCIVQMRYDPVTLVPRDNPDYEICVRHKGFIEDYLSVLGCELVHDPQEHIFRLKGEGVEAEKISLTTTIIILLDSWRRTGSNGDEPGRAPYLWKEYESAEPEADGGRMAGSTVPDE